MGPYGPVSLQDFSQLPSLAACVKAFSVSGIVKKISCGDIERCRNVFPDQARFQHQRQRLMFHRRIDMPVDNDASASRFGIHYMRDADDIEEESPEHRP